MDDRYFWVDLLERRLLRQVIYTVEHDPDELREKMATISILCRTILYGRVTVILLDLLHLAIV